MPDLEGSQEPSQNKILQRCHENRGPGKETVRIECLSTLMKSAVPLSELGRPLRESYFSEHRSKDSQEHSHPSGRDSSDFNDSGLEPHDRHNGAVKTTWLQTRIPAGHGAGRCCASRELRTPQRSSLACAIQAVLEVRFRRWYDNVNRAQTDQVRIACAHTYFTSYLPGNWMLHEWPDSAREQKPVNRGAAGQRACKGYQKYSLCLQSFCHDAPG